MDVVQKEFYFRKLKQDTLESIASVAEDNDRVRDKIKELDSEIALLRKVIEDAEEYEPHSLNELRTVKAGNLLLTDEKNKKSEELLKLKNEFNRRI